MDQPRRATVWWNDAHYGAASVDREELDREHTPLIFGLTGWLVRQDEIGVSIAGEWMPPQPVAHHDVRHVHFIPHGMIVNVEYLDT